MNSYSKDTLMKTLLSLDLTDAHKLDEIFKSSHSLEEFEAELIDNDLITEDTLLQLIGDITSSKYINLQKTSINKEILHFVPEVVARAQQIVPFKKDKDGLHVAIRSNDTAHIFTLLKKKCGDTIIPYWTTGKGFEKALSLYLNDVEDAFNDIIKKKIKDVKGKESEPQIVEIVEKILSYSYQNGASDIHVEPLEKESLVRFRIDGILHDIVRLPRDLHDQMVTRIKVMANLRTDEHYGAQDGKLFFEENGEEVDVRVSLVPITEGEKVVLRLMSERSRKFTISSLGISSHDMQKIREALKSAHGMILATGPTGSGKTTTLYSLLKDLNKREVNIMTIEDPVEYDMKGVNQIQVNTQTDLTFAKGLRSIVRQDPDIILIGEIRDEDTAGIAINSAMTGHLVLSTLHTNTAATAIPRLIDMKIKPYLVGSGVIAIIAQRLVRKICHSCRVSHVHSGEELGKKLSSDFIKKHFGNDVKSLSLYHGKGCEVCHETGYAGRVGIYEILIIDDEIREAIELQKDASAIQKIAVKNGMTTMLVDGIEKVKQGLTTIDEIIRVTSE